MWLETMAPYDHIALAFNPLSPIHAALNAPWAFGPLWSCPSISAVPRNTKMAITHALSRQVFPSLVSSPWFFCKWRAGSHYVSHSTVWNPWLTRRLCPHFQGGADIGDSKPVTCAVFQPTGSDLPEFASVTAPLDFQLSPVSLTKVQDAK